MVAEKVQGIQRSLRLSIRVGRLFPVQVGIGLVEPRWALFVPCALPLVCALVTRLSSLKS